MEYLWNNLKYLCVSNEIQDLQVGQVSQIFQNIITLTHLRKNSETPMLQFTIQKNLKSWRRLFEAVCSSRRRRLRRRCECRNCKLHSRKDHFYDDKFAELEKEAVPVSSIGFGLFRKQTKNEVVLNGMHHEVISLSDGQSWHLR